jgi:hypothetical protein
MKTTLIWLTLWLGLLAHSNAHGTPNHSPQAWPECLPRAWGEVEYLATADEWAAIRAITRDGRSKGLVDFVSVHRGETALGWIHQTLERGTFYASSDKWDNLAVLYSDAAPGRLYSLFRRKLHPVRRAAANVGCVGSCLVEALAIGNSRPTNAARWVSAGLSPCDEWIRGTVGARRAHRERRCSMLGVL